MCVKHAGGTEQLQAFHSDEDYNEEYMRTLSIVDVHIFVKTPALSSHIYSSVEIARCTLIGGSFFQSQGHNISTGQAACFAKESGN